MEERQPSRYPSPITVLESGPGGLFEQDWFKSLVEAAAGPLQEAVARGRDPEQALQAIASVARDSIPEVSEVLARSVEREARSALRYNRQLRAGFERRLRKRWAKGFDIYEIVLSCAMEVGEEYMTHHGPSVEGTPAAAKLYALIGLHARACRTGAEVLTLLTSGFPVGANARWRTIHELAIVTSLLAEHAPELSQRFLDHAVVERATDAEEYQNCALALNYPPLSAEELNQLREARARMIQQYGSEFRRDNGWAATLTRTGKAPTIRDLEVMARLKHLRPYYRLSSHVVHAGARASELNISRRGPETTLMVGAVNSGLAELAHASLISLLQVTANLVLYGRQDYVGYNEAVLVGTLHKMIEKAGPVFAKIEAQLDEEERRLWEADESVDRNR